MKHLEIFYQVEALSNPHHIQFECGQTFEQLKSELCKRHNLTCDVLIFIEDEDMPCELPSQLHPHHKNCLKVHLHHCSVIEVTVRYNGQAKIHKFSPATTITKVKNWITSALGMTDIEASEHALQVTGTDERPSGNTHIGTLTHCRCCELSFDLLPEQRVNG